jgi:hypothetical protein
MKKEEEPRLYSRGYRMRTPVDEVAPQHRQVHELLTRWGAWCRVRGARRGLLSVEGLYTTAGMPPSTAPLSSDPQIMRVERAVLRLPLPHLRTLRWLYVSLWTPLTICKALRPPLRYEAWPAHIATCRSMVINRMRFQDS